MPAPVTVLTEEPADAADSLQHAYSSLCRLCLRVQSDFSVPFSRGTWNCLQHKLNSCGLLKCLLALLIFSFYKAVHTEYVKMLMEKQTLRSAGCRWRRKGIKEIEAFGNRTDIVHVSES